MADYRLIRDCIVARLPETRCPQSKCAIVRTRDGVAADLTLVAVRRGEKQSLALLTLEGKDGMQAFLRVETPVGTTSLRVPYPTAGDDVIVAVLEDEDVLRKVLPFFPDVESHSLKSKQGYASTPTDKSGKGGGRGGL